MIDKSLSPNCQWNSLLGLADEVEQSVAGE